MKIAIIGAGRVGTALARGWANAGHEVIFGVRNLAESKRKTLVAGNKHMDTKTVVEAAQAAEVILISIPVAAINDVAHTLGEMKDKIIIDATNSTFQKPAPYGHGVEAFKAITKCEDVVKCFNSTGFENLANPKYGEVDLDMFVAGSSQKGKSVATQLARDLGFAACYDFGGDDKVAWLEQFALCWINLAIMQKHGRNMAFKILWR